MPDAPIFYLVLYFVGLQKGALTTIPMPYPSELECQKAGDLWVTKAPLYSPADTPGYVCIPNKIFPS